MLTIYTSDMQITMVKCTMTQSALTVVTLCAHSQTPIDTEHTSLST